MTLKQSHFLTLTTAALGLFVFTHALPLHAAETNAPAASSTASDATPLDAPLQDDGITRIACMNTQEEPVGMEPGELTKKGLYHYDLYLPPSYSTEPASLHHPVLFIYNQDGNAQIGSFQDRARRDGWIVAMIVEARNGPWSTIVANGNAANDDLLQRVRIDPEMKFATGTGSAGQMAGLNMQMRPGFRGLILQNNYSPFIRSATPYSQQLRKMPYFLIYATGRELYEHTFKDINNAMESTGILLSELHGVDFSALTTPQMERVTDWLEGMIFTQMPQQPWLKESARSFILRTHSAIAGMADLDQRAARAALLLDAAKHCEISSDTDIAPLLAELKPLAQAAKSTVATDGIPLYSFSPMDGQRERETFQADVDDLFMNGDFEKLEALGQLLLKNKSRYNDGTWKIDDFVGAHYGIVLEHESNWEPTLKRLNEWKIKYPSSSIQPLFSAFCWLDYGSTDLEWKLKDDAKPTEDDLKNIVNCFSEARSILEGNPQLKNNPSWYSIMSTIAFYQDWPREDSEKLFKEGIQKFPDFYGLYFRRISLLLHKDGYSERSWHQFALESSKKYSGSVADEMYSRMVWSVMETVGSEKEMRPYLKNVIQWARFQRGFETMLQRNPSPYNLQAFCYFCCIGDQRIIAQKLFKQIGTSSPSTMWSFDHESRYKQYEAWRAWALENKPAPMEK